MKKPPDPTLTLGLPLPRRSPRLAYGAIDGFYPSQTELSPPSAYPLWLQSSWISGINEYLSFPSSLWYGESSTHSSYVTSSELLWIMVYLLSCLFMKVMVAKSSSKYGQICCVLIRILQLYAPPQPSLHRQLPTTVVMAFCYSDGQILHSESLMIESQRALRSARVLTRSSGNFLFPSFTAHVNGYKIFHLSLIHI